VRRLIKNTTKKTTNKIQAIELAVPARPVNPNTPAIKARIRKVIAQLNILIHSFHNVFRCTWEIDTIALRLKPQKPLGC
jgi:hypothetical protein